MITDRRAGRHIEKKDALDVAKELEEKIKLSEQGASVTVLPTIGHRVTVIIRVDGKNLSSNITNTDPAYARIDGMGIAKAVGDFLRIDKCHPIDELR